MLRKCKRNKNSIIADKLADKFKNKNDREFWKDIRNMTNSKVNLPNMVHTFIGDEIPEMWKNHYQSVFNCVDNSNCSDVMFNIKQRNVDFFDTMVISVNEISEIIRGLSNGKAAGTDNLTAENLKYADLKLPTLLSLFVTSVLFHGHLPNSLIESVIVPIIKDKNKRVSDKNNYRPIGLSNICTKILEKLLLCRMEDFMCISANQFRFKRKHGTDMCVYVLKELIRYYTKHGSQMFVAYLDASRAFDRLNHTKLLLIS